MYSPISFVFSRLSYSRNCHLPTTTGKDLAHFLLPGPTCTLDGGVVAASSAVAALFQTSLPSSNGSRVRQYQIGAEQTTTLHRSRSGEHRESANGKEEKQEYPLPAAAANDKNPQRMNLDQVLKVPLLCWF